ncbi:MAG TPA: hypothetical protein VEJ41_09490 [Candidatus Acidoferrales bacterium]|nr:hypothetical protein [Candidatus Acidoferrales bacterium]
MTDFTFVTYRDLPELDPDDRLAVDALRKRGFSVAAAVWDDPAVAWAASAISVIRSTWDYNLRYAEFLAWAERAASLTRLYNPIELVRWNTHKRYLEDLARKSVPVVPTHWLERGAQVDLGAVLAETGWTDAVAKPAVGLATYGVRRIDAGSESQAHVNALLLQHDVMVQPFLTSVISYGERALVFIDGTYSHAVRKKAFQALAPAGLEDEAPVEATVAEIQAGVAALRALPQTPLYARIDVVLDEKGNPLVIELELVEPSLFLSMHPRAPERFADALARLAERATP